MNASKTIVAGAVLLTWLLAGSAAWASRLLVVSLGSSSPDTVRRYSETTGAFLDAIDPEPELNGIGSMAWGPDGNLYLGDRGSNSVLRYDGRTGAELGEFVASANLGLSGSSAMTFGPDGNLYVADSTHVLRYNGQSGALLGVFVPAGSGGLQVPGALVFGPDGSLYVGSYTNPYATSTSSVLRYNGQTGAFIDAFVPLGSGGLNGPTGIVFGPDGNLYVGSGATNSILRYQGQTGAFLGAFVSSGSGGLNGPAGLAFGPDVNLYVASLLTNSVLRYDGQSGAFLNAFVPAGSGGLVNPAWLLFPPPDAPTGLTGWSTSPTQINLYWTDQSPDETAFAIWRRSGSGSFARVGVVGPNVTAFSDTAVSPGTTYTYRVRAISNVGASLWSNDWICRSLTTPPVAPSNLIATVVSPTQITLTWADNSSNETGFAIFRKSVAADFARVGAAGANTTTFADPSLVTGTTYIYRVAAVAADGSLTWSGEAVGALVPPAAPTGLAAVATAATQITLTWTDNSNNETAFAVWRKSGGGSYTRVGVVVPNTTRYVDSGLAANTTYTYEVRATNNVGASGWTNEATQTAPP